MMRPYRYPTVPSSEITSESVYFNRRAFLKAGGAVAAALLLNGCGVNSPRSSPPLSDAAAETPSVSTVSAPFANANADEFGDALTSFDDVTHYNNYYEFTTDKAGVAPLSQNFAVSPWTVEVGGLVHKPKTYGIEDFLSRFPQEERVYRLRCVEGWSMVIPWLGFELNQLLQEVEPLGSARYVAFTTLLDRDRYPGQKSPFYPWPYSEGLRLDEAMHRLTILATGLYGNPLPNQNGAPLRLVVPWKYGFKSIKAIVKIELTEQQPSTLWNTIAPNEYGFYANVNPEVDHPRWSQATERRIGEGRRRQTLMFNGYADEVASLYADMDLRINY